MAGLWCLERMYLQKSVPTLVQMVHIENFEEWTLNEESTDSGISETQLFRPIYCCFHATSKFLEVTRHLIACCLCLCYHDHMATFYCFKAKVRLRHHQLANTGGSFEI